MKYAKKWKMVPFNPDLYIPLTVKSSTNLDNQMTEILNNPKLSNDEKAKLYTAALIKFKQAFNPDDLNQMESIKKISSSVAALTESNNKKDEEISKIASSINESKIKEESLMENFEDQYNSLLKQLEDIKNSKKNLQTPLKKKLSSKQIERLLAAPSPKETRKVSKNKRIEMNEEALENALKKQLEKNKKNQANRRSNLIEQSRFNDSKANQSLMVVDNEPFPDKGALNIVQKANGKSTIKGSGIRWITSSFF